ncbi:MAG: phosphatidylglycerophosphatase A [Rickettsiales bacterium]|jgi:phosphatidylglycerophosphatase A|nr:phosphatidylglycerophosphatase A [Rickettsiales bacterium]
MTPTNKKTFFFKIIATFFGAGLSKVMPGTCGSLAAAPFSFALFWLGRGTRLIIFFPISILVVFVVGLWASHFYTKGIGDRDDPQEIVIDEVAGQMLSYFLSFIFIALADNRLKINFLANPGIFSALAFGVAPFFWFRFYDIKKPSLVGYIDKNFKNAFGIMMDDIAAGVFAAATNGLTVFLFAKFFL